MITQDNKTCLPYKFIDVSDLDGFFHVRAFDYPETGPFIAIGRFNILSLPGKAVKMITERMFTVDGVVAACYVTKGDWRLIIVNEHGEIIYYDMVEYPKWGYAKINGQMIKYVEDNNSWEITF